MATLMQYHKTKINIGLDKLKLAHAQSFSTRAGKVIV